MTPRWSVPFVSKQLLVQHDPIELRLTKATRNQINSGDMKRWHLRPVVKMRERGRERRGVSENGGKGVLVSWWMTREREAGRIEQLLAH